jgi:phospholipid/cholesterol/gamma-HCH transport system substrate-binding protein
MPQNRLPVVGAFVIGGLLLFAVGLFLIGDRRMLFSDTFEIYAEFSQIAGLQNGAKVRVAGLDAGEVEGIHIPASPSAKFRVRMRVREDVRGLLRLDSVATIQNDGLVGNKFIQVEAGTDASPPVPERGTIQSREPFDLAQTLQKMSDAIDMVTSMVTEVKGGVDAALASFMTLASDAQQLVKDVGGEFRAITASSHRVADDLRVVVSGIRNGRGSIGKFVNDDTLFLKAKAIAEDAQKAVANLRGASEDARAAIANFQGENGPVQGITGQFQQTLASVRETFEDLAENAEALKRNFFFRGFFNKRGFFDLDTVSVEDYRQGALETKDRKVLRVWVSSAVLFEKDATGRERLTDDGRQRLDSAMAAFIRYPRDTPFVVEGYAAGITTDERFVASRSRAQLVREYLQGKFGLDGGYVGVMPLGNTAPGSPTDGTWDGVALAMFVQTTPR